MNETLIHIQRPLILENQSIFCKCLHGERSKAILQYFLSLGADYKYFTRTVKPVYNDQPRDPKLVVVIDKWSLFGGNLCYERSKWDYKMMGVIGRWLLFGGSR